MDRIKDEIKGLDNKGIVSLFKGIIKEMMQHEKLS